MHVSDLATKLALILSDGVPLPRATSILSVPAGGACLAPRRP